jgi:hypothetical protein
MEMDQRHVLAKQAALQLLQRYNPHHKPSGPGGGQFTSGDGDGGGAGAGDKTIHHDLSKPGEGTQPVASLEELYQKAKADEAQFQKDLEEVAKQTDGEVVLPPKEASYPGTNLKSMESTLRKLRDELDGDFTQLKDILRGTIANDTVAASRTAALKFIEQNSDSIMRVKDRFVSSSTGYRDILVNYRTKSGIIAEVQFNSKLLLKAKFGEGHKLYERQRAPGLSKAEALALKQQEASIYDSAYTNSGNGNWGKP